MKWVDKWIVRHTDWIKPLDDLTLNELFKLQEDVGKAIAKKMKIPYFEPIYKRILELELDARKKQTEEKKNAEK